MNFTDTVDAIKASWRDIYPHDKQKGKYKGIICPLCGSGSGTSGTGITEDESSANHFLKCWNGGCSFNKGGSVIDLYMLEHRCTFAQAVKELAALLHIHIDEDGTSEGSSKGKPSFSGKAPATSTASSGSAGADEKQPQQPQAAPEARRVQPPETPTDYTAYIAKCIIALHQSKEGQAYLQKRGISLETADRCGIGFDAEWISPTAIKRQRAKGSKWTPPAHPAIIIPSDGSTHYVARDIRPDAEISDPNYKKVNEGSPQLFSAFNAIRADAEYIFVTEGAFDALSLWEVGAPAIALNSTSNADKLLKELEEQPTSKTLILCLDADEAGRKTTEKLKDGLAQLNICYVVADICGGHKDPNEALTADKAAFEKAVQKTIRDATIRPDNTAAYLDRLMAGEIERFIKTKDRKTGYANLDAKAGGLNAGLYILAAISSLGKTTFALQMADQLAAQGQEVLFFSLEQSRLEMVSKSLARLTAQEDPKTAADSLTIRKGFTSKAIAKAKEDYKEQVGNRLSIIEGNFNCDMAYIADYTRRYIQKTGATPIVFVDYLQILQPAADGKSKNSKRDSIDLTITELKRLSRELDITLIVISSINRANYMTPFAFESLKESGQIEFTADVVWGLQLTCLDEPLFDRKEDIKAKRARVDEAKKENERKIKFICLKNRYGISNYNCYFTYYPRYDYFIAAPEPEQQQSKPAKRF